MPSVVRTLLAGENVELGAGGRLRDFMDVRDAGAAFAALLDSSVPGPVNIASGRAATIAQLVQQLAQHLGDEKHSLQFGSRKPVANDPDRLLADIARLRDEVGFSPQYGLERGLEDAVKWWRERSSQGRTTACPL